VYAPFIGEAFAQQFSRHICQVFVAKGATITNGVYTMLAVCSLYLQPFSIFYES